jgi:hypothetical protein
MTLQMNQSAAQGPTSEKMGGPQKVMKAFMRKWIATLESF